MKQFIMYLEDLDPCFIWMRVGLGFSMGICGVLLVDDAAFEERRDELVIGFRRVEKAGCFVNGDWIG